MNLIDTIQKMKDNEVFNNYIDNIVFPYYKNIKENSKINFNFPFTAFVGKNGSGKSSALRAMYGVPKGYSCGDFWFSTDVDPIVEVDNDGKRNCFYYEYSIDKNNPNKNLQVLKQRAKRDGNPDYWEPSDPVLKLGMKKGKRNPPVEKNVIYLDFRGEISAFDKYFYFDAPKEGKKQDFLRNKSRYLIRAFNNKPLKYRGNFTTPMVKKAYDLDPNIIKEINFILGKNYSNVRVLQHRIYGRWGTSVLLKSKYDLNYSEANAGSGEISTIQLVEKVLTARDYSLILLDEPEVSLHPAAQKRMQLFLLEQVKNKKHQVIISTHSSILIQELPNSAIKLFIDNNDGKFKICENVSYNEAFYDLEERVLSKKRIVCEDFSAKILTERILHSLNLSQYFKVDFFPGGASSIIKKYVPVYALEESKDLFLLLDGDQYTDSVNIDELPHKLYENENELNKIVTEVYGSDVPIYVDGSKSQSRPDQKCEAFRKYINFHKENIFYLPNSEIPEQILLKSNYVKTRYAGICNKYNPISKINAKIVIEEISQTRGDTSINSTIDALTTELIGENELEEVLFLKDILEQMYNINKNTVLV